jgi:hypothetical protein
MVSVISARRRWLAGALLVGVGWLASPSAVPVYDGVAAPDEPYRYVVPPAGATRTAAASSAATDIPVKNGGNAQGFSMQTNEVGPQVSVFLPQLALSAKGSPLHASITPAAAADVPTGLTADGNAYVFAFTAPGGPVTVNETYAGTSTLYLRATNQRQPQPVMYFRPDPTSTWTRLDTTSSGLDVRVAGFRGPGQYVLIDVPKAASSSGGGTPLLPLVLVGILVVLVAVVMVVRLRAAAE